MTDRMDDDFDITAEAQDARTEAIMGPDASSNREAEQAKRDLRFYDEGYAHGKRDAEQGRAMTDNAANWSGSSLGGSSVADATPNREVLTDYDDLTSPVDGNQMPLDATPNRVTCLGCGLPEMAAHAGGYKCRSCGREEPADATPNSAAIAFFRKMIEDAKRDSEQWGPNRAAVIAYDYLLTHEMFRVA